VRTSDVPPPPFFSVVISTYNRRQVVMRCVESCLRQTFPSFEVVVVDDGSTDGTREALEARDDPRIRVVAHGENRGINPSRHTGVTHSRGEWLVVVDSDWELYPHSLQRLHEIIGGLPDGIRVVRSRLHWDDGHISPSFVPDAPIGYEERIRWVEDEGGDDAARCLHRDVFRSTPYISDRRGAMEALYELNLARNERALYVEDVLGMEHTDAANSYLRSSSRREVVPRLLREAQDMRWMAETTLALHGPALREHGPRQFLILLRVAAQQAFLMGARRDGLAYAVRHLRLKPADPMLWPMIALGLIGRRALANGTVVFRRLTMRG
jgi:glycosyltransferase involved in cell wall biosynthesis